MKQKRTLSADPSARKAKGQPRGEKIANAPILPHTIEVDVTHFVAYFLHFQKRHESFLGLYLLQKQGL
ncbi:hypothetical protein QNI19_28155 [Cytophagaceae bacterium DM2B3-1]|uniref:Uncharacterized protein n=1 Tax=Xanthocytophaga flava TaxID=3048013 RepID=A0ABT7CT43_9BACT|nr:hypothetical protein [Xanthocytophaga flavus]MDJ1496841.1 hypothetical protein [Xanthocytophaga flavus]